MATTGDDRHNQPRRKAWRLSARVLAGLAVVGAGIAGCGIALQRDFAELKPQQIVFDDSCGLQDYFDTIEIKKGVPPNVVSSSEIESSQGKRVSGGRTRFSFETDLQKKTLLRLLTENWRRLPPQVATAEKLDLEVRWSEKAGVRRVVTDRDAELSVGKESWPLPYQVCLSELLFGAPLYHTRRELLGLPALVIPPPDGGAGAGGDDGGVAADH